MNGMKFKNWLQHKVLPLVIAGVVGLLPALVGIHPSQVIGESMAPTLRDQSIHLIVPVWKPQRGDIVTLQIAESEHPLVKRIVAGPGDAVLHQGEMIILESNEYYVLGDNRSVSMDSRMFGPVHRSDITGRLLF